MVFDKTVDYLRTDVLSEFERASVNLSSASLSDDRLLLHVKNALKSDHSIAKRLTFEITEDAAISNFDIVNQYMSELVSLGAEFSLDDFGVAFASFDNLKKLPFHHVKIDGGFIKNIHTDMTDQMIVKSVVEVAKTLNLKVVAEFVENEEQVKLLNQMGVDYLQGFLYHKPTAI